MSAVGPYLMIGGPTVVVVRNTMMIGGIVNGVQITEGLHGFWVVVVAGGGFVGVVGQV